MDWSATPLGPVEGWPQSLRTTVSICLASDLPICIIWGPGLVQLYNDAYRVICGNKHPRSMGQNFSECWKEAWPVIGEAHDSALTGDTAFLESQQIFLERHGYVEECFFTFSFSPVRDEAGRVGGLFHPVIEMTTQMLSERRTRALHNLTAQTGKAKSVSEALSLSAHALAEYAPDLPFVRLYALEPNGDQAQLVSATDLHADPVANLNTAGTGVKEQPPWPLEEVVRSGSAVQVHDVRQRIGLTSFGPYPEPPDEALALPIILPGAARPVAVFIAGVSARLRMNEAYRSFYDMLAAAVTTAAANARAHDDERRRVKALAELDRAKTAFFSNVSHEFRTPLTLMLGPVEDALAALDENLPPLLRERLEVVHRNGLRLHRLVNTLLDFSRIEAGRVRAAYEPTALAEFTADLASNFRSACEKAGLKLRVDCPPLGEPVFVDSAMWEKIVLNLLSNAFKFTFEGEISVSLRQADRAVELRVRDTGTGVPAEEIPRLFERFYRVENARGRTHEGSGIGLALVQELVNLHGGSITAESEAGRGTTFTVSIPLGSKHLPPDQVGNRPTAANPTTGASPFVEEALRWLPDVDQRSALGSELPSIQDDPTGPATSSHGPDDERPLVLVADDNADMRKYVVRLLDAHYRTEAVPDGEAAFAAARERIPDLILTDVMMPRLDGFGLLQALRADPRTSGVPVIMLSARAGEESRIEGMQEGADDYLAKPFSAKELLARVTAHLKMARLRRESSEALRASGEQFRALISASSDIVYRMNADWTEMRQLQGREFIADTLEPNCSWLEKYIQPCDQQRVTDTIREAVRTKGPFELEHQVLRIDGTLGWTFSRAIPLMDNHGTVVEWFGMASDVTARKRGEQECERLVARLQQEDQRKDEFLATLAHELRNPLAPIRNGLQIMRLAPGDAEATERIRLMMERQLGQMVHLIDDLLDMSRISRGKIDLRKEHIDLATAIQGAIEASRPAIAQADHELLIKFPPGPIYVDADLTRLAQVFSNLLNNAVKFTDRGGRIQLRIQQLGAEAVVSIQDNGSGIPTHMLPHVFQMFTQVDDNLKRSQGGLGIGLSIVKRLVEMHGGSVEARSEGQGRGSEFVVRLPVALSVAGDEPTVQPDPVYPITRHRILVVDDNVDAANSLSQLLEMLGNEVITCYDGESGIKAARKFRPDILLCDIGMPKMNGYDTARSIRAEEWGKNTVLVALTGYGQMDDLQRSADAGFDHHMVKPLDVDALMALLAGLQPQPA
ncbi:ATP-binding protein [Polaromonas sp.]|uniref:ATP-binding protein n=1 Tax=Polaromonas sp. TaxID=1869339 RepID=UPI0025DD6326|nr:ATP-binding protein [Polaromonas sp.]